jgi:hypothetical protein
VAGCCECGDEPSGSCATELVSYIYLFGTFEVFERNQLMMAVMIMSME